MKFADFLFLVSTGLGAQNSPEKNSRREIDAFRTDSAINTDGSEQ